MGGLGLVVGGPSEAKMSCMDNKDGSCSVEYIPYEPGTYSLNISYGGHQVPGEEVVASAGLELCACPHPVSYSHHPFDPPLRQSFQGPCA